LRCLVTQYGIKEQELDKFSTHYVAVETCCRPNNRQFLKANSNRAIGKKGLGTRINKLLRTKRTT